MGDYKNENLVKNLKSYVWSKLGSCKTHCYYWISLFLIGSLLMVIPVGYMEIDLQNY